MGLARWTTIAAVIALAVADGAGVAEAQGNICLDLEARLVQIDRGASSGNRRQYDAPIAQQRNEIDRATAEARRAGCVAGFFIFQRTPEAKCGKLMATIGQMRANLQRLMSARGQFGNDPFLLARERSDVLRSLAFNRCGPTYASNDGIRQEGGGLFASLFGPRFRTFGEGDFSQGLGFGTYRTLCVRTCDGFYFPISFSTVPAQFGADEATCQAMCPGAEAALYTHRNPGEDTSQMVALSGDPYAALPNAFRFRQEFDKTCTCHSAAASAGQFTEFSTPGAVDQAAEAPIALVTAPMPRLRPAAGEDPETVANRAGDLVPKPVTPSEATEIAGVTADGQKKIRVVGPTYYYAQ